MIQKINILDSSQSGVKNGADSEAVLAALIEHLELINPSGRLSQNTRSAMLQLREEEWSEFFFWLLNSLECLDYVIINLTPESKKTGNDSNLLIVFYVQIMPDDLVMQLHRF